ncbi:MAG: polymerase subunit delta [Bacilli bacterium]|nr:polymerase subunit delta [Bacilli bacterium]
MNWPRQGMHTRLLDQSYRAGLSHAYLFVGPEGSGKYDTARFFIQKIFCLDHQDSNRPCGECSACRKIESGNHPDLQVIAPDGQTIKIAQIRALQSAFSLKAVEAARKVYLIQSADLMTPEAANAMLKFLEEPAYPCVAILMASHPAKLLPTIVSRCQVIPFPAQNETERIDYFQQKGVPIAQAKLLARVMGDHEEQLAIGETARFAEVLELVVQLTTEFVSKQKQPMQLIHDKIIKIGWSLDLVLLFLDCLGYWFRDLMYLSSGLESELIYSAYREQLVLQLKSLSTEQLLKGSDVILNTKRYLQLHGNLQMALEAMVLQMQGEFRVCSQ